jgi:hypothetical protein
MKKIYASLLVMLSAVFFTQQVPANPYYQYSGIEYDYDLSDYLDMEAVITVFSRSGNVRDFEHKLNDYRNQVSNLDLNNDGYVDYLRTVKLTARNQHIILVQAVLGRNYFQDVMTIVVGKDRLYRDYVQFIGDPDLYGYDYIIEPDFHRRPNIVRWLWNNSPDKYISRYYWGFYPVHFRIRPLLSINIYYDHIFRFRDSRHYYRYHDHRVYPLPIEIIRPYYRNDFWKNHNDRRFENRHRDVPNRRHLQTAPDRQNPPARQPEVKPRENERREVQPGGGSQGQPRVTPPTDRRGNSEMERQRPEPQRVEPQRQTPPRAEPQRVEPQRQTPQRVEPQRQTPPRAEPQRVETQRQSPVRVETPRPAPQRREPAKVEKKEPARSNQQSAPAERQSQSRERNKNDDKKNDRSESSSSPRR